MHQKKCLCMRKEDHVFRVKELDGAIYGVLHMTMFNL